MQVSILLNLSMVFGADFGRVDTLTNVGDCDSISFGIS